MGNIHEKSTGRKAKDLHGKKAELRKKILNRRNTLLSEQKQIWDRQILFNLIQYDQKNPCFVYLCYVSFGSEVSTKEFILWCLENDKTVFVPKVVSDKVTEAKEIDADPSFRKAEMEFYQITKWEELKAGYQGILEPDAIAGKSFFEWIAEAKLTERKMIPEVSEIKKYAASEKTGNPRFRMLLPGAVFDRSGNRIGYGGGFYDRWLSKWNHYENENSGILEKTGLAYQIQMVDQIPAESFDQRVDLVMTEEFIRNL